MKLKRKGKNSNRALDIFNDEENHDALTTPTPVAATNLNSILTLANDNHAVILTSSATNLSSSSSSDNKDKPSSSHTNDSSTTITVNKNFSGRNSSSKVWLYATKSDDSKLATCNLCGHAYSVASHSTSAIRYHLIRKHKKHDLIINPSSSSSKSLISENLKRELHTLCYNAIIIDHRPFNDMRKKGLLAIFNKLCPGVNNLLLCIVRNYSSKLIYRLEL